jgi:hypothetical protein
MIFHFMAEVDAVTKWLCRRGYETVAVRKRWRQRIGEKEAGGNVGDVGSGRKGGRGLVVDNGVELGGCQN